MLFRDISMSQYFRAQELKKKSEDKLQKVDNILNKTVKIHDVKMQFL